MALKALVSAYASNFVLLKKKLIDHFEINFKSKKEPRQTFYVNKDALGPKNLIFRGQPKIEIFTRRLGSNAILNIPNKKDAQKLHFLILCEEIKDFSITWKRPNLWILNVPYKCSDNLSSPNPRKVVAALDPGEVIFQTFYSPDGEVGKLGERFADKKIEPLLRKLDQLDSLKKNHNIKAKMGKLRNKISSKVKDLRNKTAKFLCETFENIIIPPFKTKPMVKGKLVSMVKRKLQALSHYKFIQTLKWTAQKYKTKIWVEEENHTTITCTKCGHVGKKLTSREFSCSKCNFSINRDINGARNICLKFLASRA